MDLSKYFVPSYGTFPDGRRHTAFVLPLPSWTKNNRVGWSKGGLRFLTPEARDMRKFIQQSVLVSPPPSFPEPWLRKPFEWAMDVFAAGYECDHALAGLADDFVKAKLSVDDRNMKRVVSEVWWLPKEEGECVYVGGQETAVPNG